MATEVGEQYAASIAVIEQFTYILTDRGTVISYRTAGIPRPDASTTLNPADKIQLKFENEIVQMAQGKNHVIFLDKAGKVYGVGDNSYHQVSPYLDREPSAGGEKNDDGSHNTPPRDNASKKEQLDRSNSQQNSMVHETGTLTGGTGRDLRPSAFIFEPQLVKLPNQEAVTIYKVHAFANTSLAFDRGGEMIVWGYNTGITYEGKPQNTGSKRNEVIPRPVVMLEFSGIKLSSQKEQIPGAGEDSYSRPEFTTDKSLQLLSGYRKDNEAKISETNTLLNEIKQKQSKVKEESNHARSLLEEAEKKLRELEHEIQILDERRQMELGEPDSSPESGGTRKLTDMKKLKAQLKEKQKTQKVLVEDAEVAVSKVEQEFSNLLVKEREYEADINVWKEQNKNLTTLANRYVQNKREAQGAAKVIENQANALMEGLYRRFSEIDKLQVALKVEREKLPVETALLRAEQEIKRESDTLDYESKLNNQGFIAKEHISKFTEMYKSCLGLLSNINRYQLKRLIEAEERSVLANQGYLKEQLEVKHNQDDDELPVFRNLESLGQKIFNFKFTNKQ